MGINSGLGKQWIIWGPSKRKVLAEILYFIAKWKSPSNNLTVLSIQDVVSNERDTKEPPNYSRYPRIHFPSTNNSVEKFNPLDIRNVKDSRLRLQDLTGATNLDISLL
jgi:hypothetical protein